MIEQLFNYKYRVETVSIIDTVIYVNMINLNLAIRFVFFVSRTFRISRIFLSIKLHLQTIS